MSDARRDYEYWLRTAHMDTKRWERERSPAAQALYLNLVVSSLTRALVSANKLNDRDRRAYCMRNLGRARALLNRIERSAA